jgi:hypothetical protein
VELLAAIVIFFALNGVNLPPDVARRKAVLVVLPDGECRVDIGMSGIGGEPSSSASTSMAATFWVVIWMTLAGVIVSVTVPFFGGHAGGRAAGGPVSQICAEEDNDAAGHMLLVEMDVSLRHRTRIRWSGTDNRIREGTTCQHIPIQIEHRPPQRRT